MRERIFNLLEGRGRATSAYAVFMTVVTALSLLPLCFKQQGPALEGIEIACTVLFIIDYAMRWATADLKLGRGGASFARYPVTPMALVDLLSILPTFLFINPAFRAVRIIRLLRVLRVFRFVRYSRSLTFVMAAFKRQRNALLAMLAVALGYVFVCALVMFNVEPEMFETFLDALYWAVVSLTTIGYGDITPVTAIGRLVVVVSGFMGIAIIALPSSIITAGLMDELRDRRENGTSLIDELEERREARRENRKPKM